MVRATNSAKSTSADYAGELGTMFVNDALLGIDQAGGEIARTTDESVRALLPAPAHRLILLPDIQDGLPFTRSLFVTGTTKAATLEISTGPWSWISTRFAQRVTSLGHTLDEEALPTGRKIPVPLVLPGNQVVMHDMWTDPSIEEGAQRYGVPRCDGILGADFWRRWLTVLDFPARQVLLYDYASVLPELVI
jgi:hypothetical protein